MRALRSDRCTANDQWAPPVISPSTSARKAAAYRSGPCRPGGITIDEVHRFVNPQRKVLGHLHWDLLYLFEEIKNGIRAAVNDGKGPVVSMGIDTWGVDFGLLGKNNELLGLPVTYRDGRTDDIPEEVFRLIPREELFAATGTQPLQINSLFQLYAVARSNPLLLDSADALLFMPDLLSLLFTGKRYSEFTIASTSQLLDISRREWSKSIMDRLGLPTRILMPLKRPGEVIGAILPDIARETGLTNGTILVTVGGHDTASAVAAVPASGNRWAFLSSGTWSLLGMEIEGPRLSPEFDAKGFTNEGGVSGNILLLKNVMGLWLLQECRKEWEKLGKNKTYDELVAMSALATPFRSLVNPDDLSFLHPGNMIEAIREFCVRSDQPPPETPGAFARCIFESLALTYRRVLNNIVALTGHAVDTLHVVGGGSRNPVLNQWTADACGITVLAGPMEATAVGNVIAQGIACESIDSWEEGRRRVGASFRLERFEPKAPERWADPMVTSHSRKSHP